jgi:hypothetical protein
MRRKSSSRRGVILLVVLGILSLFMLIAVSYVLTAGNERRGALAASRAEQFGDPHDALLKSALLEVVRGPRDPNSVIGPHSLLEDMYGDRDSVVGMIPAFPGNATTQTIGNDLLPNGTAKLTYTPSPLMLPVISTAQGPAASAAPAGGQTVYNASGREIIEIVGVSFGPDGQPGVAGQDDDGDGIIDNNDEWYKGEINPNCDDCRLENVWWPGVPKAAGANYTSPFRFNTVTGTTVGPAAVEGYYAGRVLTMLNGLAAKQSTRIIRWFYDTSNLPAYTTLSTAPPKYCNPSNATQTENQRPGGYWKLWIRPFENGQVPQPGDRFVINGRPFNGTGFGYNSAAIRNSGITPLNSTSLGAHTGLLNQTYQTLSKAAQGSAYPYLNPISSNPAADDMYEFALMPNPTDQKYRDFMNDRRPPPPDPTNPFNMMTNIDGVDADEDYDAPDFQNMMLAARTWNSLTQRWEVRIPSLHRPELVNYWLKSGRVSLSGGAGKTPRWDMIPSSASTGGRIRQRIMLRPDPQDHAFTSSPGSNGKWNAADTWIDLNGNGRWDGSSEPIISDGNGNGRVDPSDPEWSGNAYFNPINGPWDVDNDNDGDPDSIWVDLGAKVQTSLDGKQFKPLFAILCVDLDGKLNLNAHGNASHYKNVPTGASSAPSSATIPPQPVAATPAAGHTDEAVLLGLNQSLNFGTPHVESMNLTGYTTQALYALTQAAQSGPANGPFPAGYPFPGNMFAGGYGWVNNYGNTASSYLNGVQVGIGSGFSVADINLGALTGPTSIQPPNGSPTYTVRRTNSYRWLLEGRFEALAPTSSGIVGLAPGNAVPAPVPGRYGESYLIRQLQPGLGQYFPNSMPRAGLTARGNFNGDDNRPMANQPGTTSTVTPFGYTAKPRLPLNAMQATQDRGNLFTENTKNYGWNGVPTTGLVNNPRSTGGPIVTYPLGGAYGSPTDVNGKMVIGLDFRGQPIYGRQGPLNEAADDPWEIDLSPKGQRQSFDPGNDGIFYTTDDTNNGYSTIEVDAPLTPGELESLLRFPDPDCQADNGRSTMLFPDLRWSVDFRNRITTESWDLPCPNLIPTPEIRDGLRYYSFVVTSGKSTNLFSTNISFADLLRGKLTAVWLCKNSGGPGSNVFVWQDVEREVSQMLDPTNPPFQPLGTAAGTSWAPVYRRVVSPDLILGLRMDLNAPFGNSTDTNASTGSPALHYSDAVVDDPKEAWGDPTNANPLSPASFTSNHMVETIWSQFFNKNIAMDLNRDGVLSYVSQSQPVFDYTNEMLARQEMAKQLYFLAMLLKDTRYVFPFKEPNLPQWDQEALTAYKIAQWAVNVVDFRDRDAINTYFEFDIYPFSQAGSSLGAVGSQSPDPYAIAPYWCVGGWDVDGVLGTTPAGVQSYDDQTAQTVNTPGAQHHPYYSPGKPIGWRGLVWGMENPELLITETAACHDKRVFDTTSETAPFNPTYYNGTPLTPRKTGGNTSTTAKPNTDPTFDQVRIPEGSAFIELYCTGKNGSYTNASNASTGGASMNDPVLHQLPRELYDTTSAVPDPVLGNCYGALDLARMAPTSLPGINVKQVTQPVWRLVISTPHLGYDAKTAIPALSASQTTTIRERAFDPSIDSAPAPANTYGWDPDSITFQPEHINAIQQWGVGSNQTQNFDRVVWFCPLNTATAAALGSTTHPHPDIIRGSGTATNPGRQIFWRRHSGAAVGSSNTNPNTNTNPNNSNLPNPNLPQVLLLPGHYAVVGPARQTTATVGALGGNFRNVTFLGYSNTWQAQYFDLDQPLLPGGGNNTPYTLCSHFKAAGAPAPALMQPGVGTQIQAPLGIPIGKDNVIAGVPNLYPSQQGLNISEPLNGYQLTSAPLKPTAGTKIPNPVNVTLSGALVDQFYPIPRDVPLDIDPRNGFLTPDFNHFTQYNMYESGTYLDFRTVFLQRLANPNLPWNPDPNDPYYGINAANGIGHLTNITAAQGWYIPQLPVNPYITVDWMPIDMTIFNGQTAWPMPPNAAVAATDSEPDPLNLGALLSWPPTPWVTGGGTYPYPAYPTAVTGANQAWSPGTYPTLPRNYRRFVGTAKAAANRYMLCLESRQRGPRVPRASIPLPPTTPPYFNVLSVLLPPGTNPGILPLGAGNMQTTGANNFGAWPAQFNGVNGVHLDEAPLWAAISDDPMPRWYNEPQPVNLPASPGNNGIFKNNMYHTFGYLNSTYGVPATGSPPTGTPSQTIPPNTMWPSFNSTPYNGTTNYGATIVDPHVVQHALGDPLDRPFPWLTWNNRPFANAMELLLVPCSSPGRFGVEFSYKLPISGTAKGTLQYTDSGTNQVNLYNNDFWNSHYGRAPNMPLGVFSPPPGVVNQIFPPLPHQPYPQLNPYLAGPPGIAPLSPPGMTVSMTPYGGYAPVPQSAGTYPFGHLLNFFDTSSPWPGAAPGYSQGYEMAGPIAPNSPWGVNSNQWQVSANFHRLLEFVHVPSRFSGTEDLLLTTQPGTVLQKENTYEAPLRVPSLNRTREIPNLVPFYVPFNRISRYREPGKININTLFDRDPSGTVNNIPANFQMWAGITNYFPDFAEQWGMLQVSRNLRDPRGTDGAWGQAHIDDDGNGRVDDITEWGKGDDTIPVGASSQIRVDALPNEMLLSSIGGQPVPSFYPNPFRSFMSTYAVPPAMAQPVGSTTPPQNPWNPPSAGAPVDSSLWHSKVTALGLFNGNLFSFADSNLLRRADIDPRWNSEPLLIFNSHVWDYRYPSNGNMYPPNPNSNYAQVAATGSAHLLPYTGGGAPAGTYYTQYRNNFRDTNRNPYFRYQPLIKTGGMFTTRSNVYAIWVTVGYFEVQRVSQASATQAVSNPDGYQLVRELGSESGDVRRHRAFAIIDRTLPVGFQRGENNNVDNVFLIKRILE